MNLRILRFLCGIAAALSIHASSLSGQTFMVPSGAGGPGGGAFTPATGLPGGYAQGALSGMGMAPMMAPYPVQPGLHQEVLPQPDPSVLGQVMPGATGYEYGGGKMSSKEVCQFLCFHVPNMVGDYTYAGPHLVGAAGVADIPIGGSGVDKIAFNGRPIPTSRAYFVYREIGDVYHAASGQFTSSTTLNMGVVGMERVTHDGLLSLDVRLPVLGSYDFNENGFGVSTEGNVGDLTLTLKRLICQTDLYAIGAGLGLTVPTGTDVEGTIGGMTFRAQNDAYRLSPYLGIVFAPDDGLFMQAYTQLSFSANGSHTISVTNAGVVTGADYDDQNWMFLGGAIGRWLYLDPHATGYMTRFGTMAELHYSHTLNDTDIVATNVGNVLNTMNATDMLNGVFALNAEFMNRTTLRTAIVMPLSDERNAPFDTYDYELQISINKRL